MSRQERPGLLVVLSASSIFSIFLSSALVLSGVAVSLGFSNGCFSGDFRTAVVLAVAEEAISALAGSILAGGTVFRSIPFFLSTSGCFPVDGWLVESRDALAAMAGTSGSFCLPAATSPVTSPLVFPATCWAGCFP